MGNISWHIRYAEEKDVALILAFIHELAAFERMADQVTASGEDIRLSLFEKRQAEVILGEANSEPAAFALFFHNYSTFLGKANLFLEDLFVKEQYRGNGFGKAMLRRLAQIAVERGCERIDWLCLDWNRPAINFYQGIDAVILDDRRVFRISGDRLEGFANFESVKRGENDESYSVTNP
ncbi:MAG TPA: GNAT family N-acetyltransferase [Firmicutes bacterium]|jgi:GNAT superfamily N-acetyltransferase|nr:GNAT family N-acetyltransferase [Bacillota bacterium]